jgi:hypothetical protein
LAIALVISTNQAFKQRNKPPYVIIEDNEEKEENPFYEEWEIPESYLTYGTPQVTPQVEPEIIEKIVEVPVEVIKEVERIVEVPVDRVVEVPVDRVVEIERRVEVPYEVEKIVEVPVVYYVKEDGTITDEEGNIISEPEKRVLKYTK